MGSRYGGLKQIDPVGPGGETLLDYSVFDALRAGFTRVVFVIRKDIEKAFREAVGRRYEAKADVAYAFQEIADVPSGFRVPRIAPPWGTAQAVLAAESVVTSPFAAANADDFYGAPPSWPCRRTDAAVATSDLYAIVGFRLGLTLSDHGSVARAVCEAERTDFSATSRFSASRRPRGGRARRGGRLPPLPRRHAGFAEPLGLYPSLFAKLRERFAASWPPAEATALRVLPARRRRKPHDPGDARVHALHPDPGSGSPILRMRRPYARLSRSTPRATRSLSSPHERSLDLPLRPSPPRRLLPSRRLHSAEPWGSTHQRHLPATWGENGDARHTSTSASTTTSFPIPGGDAHIAVVTGHVRAACDRGHGRPRPSVLARWSRDGADTSTKRPLLAHLPVRERSRSVDLWRGPSRPSRPDALGEFLVLLSDYEGPRLVETIRGFRHPRRFANVRRGPIPTGALLAAGRDQRLATERKPGPSPPF